MRISALFLVMTSDGSQHRQNDYNRREDEAAQSASDGRLSQRSLVVPAEHARCMSEEAADRNGRSHEAGTLGELSNDRSGDKHRATVEGRDARVAR
jgi:hypothetical protein